MLQNYKMNGMKYCFSSNLNYGSLSILILSSCIHFLIKPNRSKRHRKNSWIRVNCIKVEVTKNRNIFMSLENLLVFLSPYPYTTFVTLRPEKLRQKIRHKYNAEYDASGQYVFISFGRRKDKLYSFRSKWVVIFLKSYFALIPFGNISH